MRRVLLTLLLLLAAASPALAASRTEVLRDCESDGRLDGTYTLEEIRDALRNMPTDIAEYSDCKDLLRRAELALLEPRPVPTQAPGAAADAPLPTPTPELVPASEQEVQTLDAAPSVAQQPVTIAGEQVVAGVSPFRDGRDGNPLPAALVVALILLSVAAAALAVPGLRRVLRRRP